MEGTGAITIGRRPDQNIVMDRKVCRMRQKIRLQPRARAREYAPARAHTVDHIANKVDLDV